MKNDGAIKLGINLNLANNIVAEMIAYYGYDFIMVDYQHSAYNREKLSSMFQYKLCTLGIGSFDCKFAAKESFSDVSHCAM